MIVLYYSLFCVSIIFIVYLLFANLVYRRMEPPSNVLQEQQQQQVPVQQLLDSRLLPTLVKLILERKLCQLDPNSRRPHPQQRSHQQLVPRPKRLMLLLLNLAPNLLLRRLLLYHQILQITMTLLTWMHLLPLHPFLLAHITLMKPSKPPNQRLWPAIRTRLRSTMF